MSQKSPPKSQVERFKEAAREAGTDDEEERFDEKLKRIAKGATIKPVPPAPTK